MCVPCLLSLPCRCPSGPVHLPLPPPSPQVWDDGLIGHAIEEVYRSQPQEMTHSLLRRINADWRPLLPGWTACYSQDQLTCPSR